MREQSILNILLLDIHENEMKWDEIKWEYK